MFSALRQNNIIYVLDKRENPTLKTGNVVAVSAPHPVFGQYNCYTVDITANVDGQNMEFRQLPSTLSIAANQPNGLVVAESKEAMSTEVEGMQKASRQLLDSVSYHKKVLAACDDMLKVLNPQYAKTREQEEKLSSLEGKMNTLETNITDIKQMLSKALDRQ